MKSPSELIKELRGTICRCGSEKGTRMTFCRPCYFSLSKPQQMALYKQLGDGYEEAYADAVTTLEKKDV